MKKLFRVQKERKIAGICVGLGYYFQLDPVLFRIVFIALLFLGASGVIIYLVMWVIVPPLKDAVEGQSLDKSLYLSTDNKKICGVCGGLGEYFDIDPIFFRVFFTASLFLFGFGLFTYIIFSLIIPTNKNCSL